MAKKLAIQFYGHLRTYEQTYQNFFQNIVEVNKNDGWEIDFFMHTWDRISSSWGSWYNGIENMHELFNERAVNNDDIKKINEIYAPKALKIETLPENTHGAVLSKQHGNELREAYQKEHKIKYDYILYTRTDILFVRPFNINYYLSVYNWEPVKERNVSLPKKHVFCCNNFFTRTPLADPRYINEGDVMHLSTHSLNTHCPEDSKGFVVIPTDYTLHEDCFLQRESGLLGLQYHILPKLQQQQQIQALQARVMELENYIKGLQ